ncbi:MAG: GHKL domain-containing protein [Lachnospiraceae bacterium]|nr:GHKL domain-containing protein [Lachnospiraceae bacterium]
MINYINQLLECFFFVIFASGLLNKRIHINQRLLSFFMIIIGQAVYDFMPLTFQNEYVFFLISTFSIIFVMKTSIDCNIKDCIFSFSITYICITLIQFPFILLDMYVFKITNYDIRSTIGLIYCICIAYLLKNFCNLNKLYSFFFKKAYILALLLCNLFVCSLILSFYYKINTSDFKQLAIFFFFSFIILIYLNIIIYNQFKRIKHDEKRLAAYDEYMPMIDELITQVRTRQHHHANEIQTIISLMHIHKDYNSLTSAMREYINSSNFSNPPEYLLKLNLRLISGFLYQKEQMASAKGINIHYDFATYNLYSKTPEYILIELFGIMIDNAIEAVSDGSVIEISISSEKEQISFQTRNAGFILTQEDRNNFFQKGYSSKKDTNKSHSGLGLYHLKQVVIEEYSGSVALWNIDKDILLKISL